MQYFEDEATNTSRSLQSYLILIGAVHRRETLTYEMLSELVYNNPRSAFTLGPKLDPLMKWCKLNNLPALTAIVVDKTTGLPRSGLTAVEGEFPAEQQRVFAHPWFSILPPTVAELREALSHSN
jgi:putative restriction endonuclease